MPFYDGYSISDLSFMSVHKLTSKVCLVASRPSASNQPSLRRVARVARVTRDLVSIGLGATREHQASSCREYYQRRSYQPCQQLFHNNIKRQIQRIENITIQFPYTKSPSCLLLQQKLSLSLREMYRLLHWSYFQQQIIMDGQLPKERANVWLEFC